MKKPMPFRKIDEFGRILMTESFDTTPAAAPEEETTEEADGPQLLKDDEEDIDIESGEEELYGAINVTADVEETEPETTTNSSMQVVSLEDVMALIKQVQDEQNPAPAVEVSAEPAVTPAPQAEASIVQDATAVPAGKGLVGGEDNLKKVYFQGEGNETLDSEFDFTKDSAVKIDDSFEESYIDSIDGLPKAYADFDDVATNGAATPRASEAGAHVYGGTTQYADMDGGDECNADMARLDNKDNDFGFDGTPEQEEELLLDGEGEPEEEELDEATIMEMLAGFNEEDEVEGEELNEAPKEEEKEEIPAFVKEFMLANGLKVEDAYAYAKKDLNEIDEEPETAPEFDGEANPDLLRIAGPIDPAQEEEEYEEFEPSEAEIAPAPVDPGVTANTTMNVGGQPIRIVLTGVVITENEIKYISESVKTAGNKLKAIKGEGNRLQIVVEANNKQYTINYVDAPKVKEPAPFAIKNYKFGTLEEALGRINHNNVPKTQAVMSQFLNESISNRGFNVATDSDIFEGLNEAKINYVQSWTVKTAGTVNLKNGLNETYSNIIQHGKEPNTLVQTTEGDYFMIKGNLRERSSVGTTRELVDMSGKKSYGVAKVVGIYENNSAGLGKIMEKIQRTSLPLLVWK